MKLFNPSLYASLILCSVAFSSVSEAQNAVANPKLSFFITSTGSGKGGDLGGLAGADKICSTLATAVGAGSKTWRAYLSADAANGQPAVNAKDRIGSGPWYNFKGEVVAQSVADLHSDSNKLGKQASLTEKGGVVNGRGDSPNMHDILTGSNPDGTLMAGKTCNNWSSSSTGTAFLGHFDKQGGGARPNSWNSAHELKSCSLPDLQSTGGNGFIYCFATN